MPTRVGPFETPASLRRDEYGEVFSTRAEGAEATLRLVPSAFAVAADAEAELAKIARIRHRGLAALIAFGRSESGELYVVNAAAPGVSLAALVRGCGSGKLPIASALRIVQAVAEAVAALHAGGLAHGRLDPDRIFVVDEEPIVADVGVGAIIGDEANELRATLPGLREASFLSPEQAAAEGWATPECDVWALGALLHFCLTGEPPFAASSRAKLVVETARRGARAEGAGSEIVASCLAREAALRPTTLEVIEQLRAARDVDSSPELRAFATSATPPDAVAAPSASREDRPRAVHVVSAFLLAVAVGVGIGVARPSAHRAPPAPPAPEHAFVAAAATHEAVTLPASAATSASASTTAAPATAPSSSAPKHRAPSVLVRSKAKPRKAAEPDPFMGVTSAGF